MSHRLYFDYNASSPLRPAARAAMISALDTVGNASSVHAEGRAARVMIEEARAKVAALVGADPRAVVFTSGATESIGLALSPDMELSGRPVHCDILLISAVEHPAVRTGGRFGPDQMETIPVNHAGLIDLEALAQTLARHRAAGRRALVSVMAANNETGVIEPVTDIAQRVHAAEGIFHTDAVQMAGRLPFDLAASGADLISLSSHKLGGPQGVGVLITRDDQTRLPPVMRGGAQERRQRAGTENVAGIVGFGASAEEARRTLGTEAIRISGLRNAAQAGLRKTAPDIVILSDESPRLPNTLCFSVPGLAAETAVIAFDLEGVAVSAGAACSSGKVGASEALAAMNLPAGVAKGAIRASLGWNTVENDIARFLEVWERVYVNLKERRRERAA